MLDASMTLCWCFDDEVTPFTEYVFDLLETTHAIAPALWPFEVASGLTSAVRQRRIMPSQCEELITKLRQLPIQIERREPSWLWQQILPLTQRHARLSVYDAAYLELAFREGLPLATLDEKLAQAAEAEKVKLIQALLSVAFAPVLTNRHPDTAGHATGS